MKRRSLWRWIVTAVVLGFAALAYRMASPLLTVAIQTPPADFARLTTTQWREDLQYLVRKLPKVHKNAFAIMSEQTFKAHAEQLDRDLAGLTGDQIVVRMMELVSQLGDAHTCVAAFAAGSGTLPIRVRWFSDGLFVIQATSKFRETIGTKIIGLGEHSVEEAYQMVGRIIPKVNDSWTREVSQQYLTNVRVLNALGVCTTSSSLRVTCERSDGTRFTTELPASVNTDQIWLQAARTLPLYEQRSDVPYWYQYLPDARAVYVRFRQCIGVRSFSSLNREIWNRVKTEQAQYMIVDMRGNGGVNSMVFEPLVSALRRDPVLSRPGHLYVVIDRGTFSSAVINAVELHEECGARLIGEPSGGRPNSFGEVRAFRLPNSRLTVTYSTKYFRLVDEDAESLMPSSVVLTSSADYLAGQDPVMNEILRLIKLSQ